MDNIVRFIVGGKEYFVDPTIFQNIIEENPSYLPRQFANDNFKKQDVYYYPDRDPEVFEAVLRYYRTKGMFTIGTHLQEQQEFVKTELDFWGIDVPEDSDCKKKIKIDQDDLLNGNDVANEFTKFCIEFIRDTCVKYKKETGLPLFSTHKFDFAISDLNKNESYMLDYQFVTNMANRDERKRIFCNSGYFITIKEKSNAPGDWPMYGYERGPFYHVELIIKFVDISSCTDEDSLSEQFDIMETGKGSTKKNNNDDKNKKSSGCQIS